MSRFRPIRTQGGAVIQSGLDAKARGTSRPAENLFGKWRGIVLNAYASDAAESFREFQVECDVVLVRNHVLLRNVPVQQPNHGVNNAQPWVPKPTTRSIASGLPLNLNPVSLLGTVIGPVISFDDLDGDMVLVEFLEGRKDLPIIVGAVNHEASKRLVIAGEGWQEVELVSSRGKPMQDEYYLNWQGTEIRINRKGDILIDTVGAHDDPVLELPVTGAGQVRIRVKGSQRFTVEMDGVDVLEVSKDGLGNVHIDLGEGATERIVLGDSFALLYNAHVHGTAIGPTGIPTVLMDAVPGTHLSLLHRVK